MFELPREAQSRTATFILTPSHMALIDLTTVAPEDAVSLHTHGIYELRDGVLKYCIGSPNEPRPTEFATQQGDRQTLAVLVRDMPAP